MNLDDRGTVARITATIRMILSLLHEEEKSQNPVHMKTKTLSLVLIPVLAYLSGSATSQAVSPPPDGGYPGGNAAEGQNALFSLTSGGYNTAVGYYSLRSNTTGSFNTAIGAGTLLANTGDQNTATGAAALLSNTSGTDNTANGVFALFSNTTGPFNTAMGQGALYGNTTGDRNTAMGYGALLANSTGASNTAVGVSALRNTTSAFNSAVGHQALVNNTTGSNNTANGYGALANNITGNGNTALGSGAGLGVTAADNVITIGQFALGSDVSNTTWINNIYGTTTVSGTTLPVLVSDTGQLGTASSSRRFKKEIKPMEQASEAILSLKPVTFHYRSDTKDTPQFGLIAEDVAAVNPDLVVPDKNGEIYTVRYDAVNAMLLNEFLKEHCTVKEQATAITDLKKEIVGLAETVKEQAAQIQKVSAQLGASKPAPQVVNNP
jgi:hypothetical protein